jgi:outer membrane protein OmpA-like peptidoglycan-associated protein
MMRGLLLVAVLAASGLGQKTAESLYQESEGKPPAEAIPLLMESIRLRPSFEAYYRLGVAQNRGKDFEKALASFKEAYRLTTASQAAERAHVFFRRAQSEEGLGKFLPAYLDVQQSLALEEHPAVRKMLHALQDKLADQEVDAAGLQLAVQTTKDFEVREVNAKPPSIPLWVNFDPNKHTMTESGKRQAQTLAGELLSPRNAGYRFLIVGHTDKTGTDAINDPLSLHRAEEVRTFLIDGKLEPGRIAVEGRGSHEPLRAGSTEADYKVNRRVEVILQPKPAAQ